MQYHAIQCNTLQYHAIQCSTMQYSANHSIPCIIMQYHATPCNTMQYQAIQCNTMQYHAIPYIIYNCWRSVPLPCGQYMAIFILYITSKEKALQSVTSLPSVCAWKHHRKILFLNRRHHWMIITKRQRLAQWRREEEGDVVERLVPSFSCTEDILATL